MENHYLRTLAQWKRQRNKVAQLAVDGDANYKWLLTNKVAQQVDEVKATIMVRPLPATVGLRHRLNRTHCLQEYWERVLPPHIRRQFDNHLLGLPLNFDPSDPTTRLPSRRTRMRYGTEAIESVTSCSSRSTPPTVR